MMTLYANAVYCLPSVCYAECHNKAYDAECHYSECLYAESHCAVKLRRVKVIIFC